jgi:NAD(P)-dependent dehydrogenase (short-subunit alcohol dehydrogenase family)
MLRIRFSTVSRFLLESLALRRWLGGHGMNVRDKVIVVTGGAGGIGSAMGRRFVAEGAKRVVLADLDGEGAERAAASIGPIARGVACDVADGGAVVALVRGVEERDGPIDLFCSNAGIATGIGVEEDAAEIWQRAWQVHVMAPVAAARALLPGWLARGEGYLLITASAAGLLTSLGDAPYTATKHAAVALAEWLAVTYGGRGVKVSCLCPQGVRTGMVLGTQATGHLGSKQVKALRLIEPEEVADCVVKALAEERFLILPHPEVHGYFMKKAQDHERWFAGMRRFQASLERG